MKTFSAKPQDIKQDWFVVDATDKVLGRLASQIALRLPGKHKPIFTPHMDTGDFIVVTHARRFRHRRRPGLGITATAGTGRHLYDQSKMQARFPDGR